MNDLFDRVAARALGLGMALRPRIRSRFEPESLASEFDNVAAGGAEVAPPLASQPLASPPTREPSGQPRSRADTATRREPQTRSEASDVASTGMGWATAFSDEREEAGSRQGASSQAPAQPDRRPLSPAVGLSLDLDRAPEWVEPVRGDDPAITQDISGNGGFRVGSAGSDGVAPKFIPDRPFSRGADDPSDLDQASASSPKQDAPLASPPPLSSSFAWEAPDRSAPPPDPAASPYEYAFYSAPPEPGRDGQPQPARRQQVGPFRQIEAARPPAIEITIGRIEIRAESPAPARQAKPFQPHLDLAAYRARRKGAP